MLNTPVFAQAAGGGGDVFMSLLPLVLIFVVFYFLLIRPQQKIDCLAPRGIRYRLGDRQRRHG